MAPRLVLGRMTGLLQTLAYPGGEAAEEGGAEAPGARGAVTALTLALHGRGRLDQQGGEQDLHRPAVGGMTDKERVEIALVVLLEHIEVGRNHKGRPGASGAGNDVTVISYLSMVARCAEAIAQTGIDAELIDLRSIWPLDLETLVASVKKTGCAVVLEDDWLTYGVRLDPWARVFANRPRLARLVATATGLPTRLPDDAPGHPEDEAPVRIFVMGGGSGRKNTDGRMEHGGRWRDEREWPLARAVPTTLHLHGDGACSVLCRSDLYAADERLIGLWAIDSLDARRRQ